MDIKLITHLTPTMSLFADCRQYILVIRSHPLQRINNGYHTYHPTLSGCFEEILSHMTKLNLADDKHKDLKKMVSIIENTVMEIRGLFEQFEDMDFNRNASTGQQRPVNEGPDPKDDNTPVSDLEDTNS